MELLLHSIQMDWPVLLPILLCSILTVAVAINRFSFYNKNKRDVVRFIRALKSELVNNRLEAAKNKNKVFRVLLIFQLIYQQENSKNI